VKGEDKVCLTSNLFQISLYEYIPYEDKDRQNQPIAQKVEGALKEKSDYIRRRRRLLYD
jgi:hypothetical protein